MKRFFRLSAFATILVLLGASPSRVCAIRLNLGGYNTLTFRHNSVRGDQAGLQAFTYGNFERQRTIENNAGLTLTLWPLDTNRLVLNANINSNRFSPDRSRYNLEYKGNGIAVMMGDITAAFSGNEFAPLHKSLRGVRVEGLIGKINLTTLFSQERAQVATDVFPGTNSPGPYALRFSPILDGTEQVRVDGQPKRLGVDYTIDYNTGMLWFQPSLIIPATSTVEVSYEYAAYGSNPGILSGVRGEIPLATWARLGLTYLTHMSQFSPGSETAARTDLFIGDNTPMVLTLRYRPVKQILKITVDSIPQTEGTDYEVVSLETGVIRFLRVVPAPPGLPGEQAANVVVEYEVFSTPSTVTQQGDRSIVGLDGNLRFGEKTGLVLQFARSSGQTSRTGTALSLRGQTQLGNLTLALNFRDVGKQFTAIESVGFQQRERAIDGSAEYRLTDHIRFTSRFGQSARPYATYSTLYSSTYTAASTTTQTSTTAESTIRALQGSLGVSMDYPKLPLVDIGHQWFRTSGLQTKTGSAMTNLRLQYALGQVVRLSANLDRSANEDLLKGGAGAVSFTQRYSATYTPGSRFNLQADYSLSHLQSRTPATGSTQTDATNANTALQITTSSNSASSVNLTATWSPIRIATLTAAYRLSDSGTGGAYGGYYGGYGLTGFGNTYYSSAYTTGSYLNSGNYSFADQYTGNFYNPTSSTLGTGFSTYSGASYSGLTSTGTTLGTSTLFPTGTLIRSGSAPTRNDTAPSNTDSTGDAPTTTTVSDSTTATPTTTEQVSTRIRNINRSIGLQLNPIERLSLTVNYSNDLQEGQFTGSNSVSSNVAFGLTYSPWDLLTFNGQVSRQRYRFLGSGGNSGSTIAFANAQVGPFHRLSLNLGYQAMTTNTGLASLSTLYGTGGTSSITGLTDTTATATLTGGSANTMGTDLMGATSYRTRLNTLTARLQYPIATGRTLFTELQHSTMRGGSSYGDVKPEDSRKQSVALGVEFSLFTHPSWGQVNWVMDLRHIRYADRNNPQRNYQGNLVTGEMRANF